MWLHKRKPQFTQGMKVGPTTFVVETFVMPLSIGNLEITYEKEVTILYQLI